VFLPACFRGANEAEDTGAAKESPLPCRMTDEGLIFRFDVANHPSLTTDDTGQLINIQDLLVESVAVAGGFNGWSRDKDQLKQVAEGVYELVIPRERLRDRNRWEFKFVVNGSYWVEPPRHYPNRALVNPWIGNHNYVIDLALNYVADPQNPSSSQAAPDFEWVDTFFKQQADAGKVIIEGFLAYGDDGATRAHAFVVTKEALINVPAWSMSRGTPVPLSVDNALKVAQEWLNRRFAGGAAFRLDNADLHQYGEPSFEEGSPRAHWKVGYHFVDKTPEDATDLSRQVVVLLDGTVAEEVFKKNPYTGIGQ